MSKISLFTVAAVAAALCSPIEAQTQSLDASVDASLGARSMRALKTERVRRPREEDPPRERRERRIETRERRPRRERGSKGGSEEMPSGEVSEDDALADFNAEGPMAVGGDYNDMGAPVGGPAMAVDIDIDTYSSGDDEYDAGFDEEEYGGAAGPTGEADTGGSTRSLMEPTSAEDVGTFETEEFEAPAAVPEEFPTSGEEYADEYEMPAEGPVEEPTMDTDSAGPAAGGDYDGMMPAGGDYDGMMPGEPVEESGEYEMMPVEGPLGEMFGDPEMVYEYDAAAPHAEGPFSDDYGMAPNSDEYGMAPFSDEYGMAPFSDGYAAAPFSDYQEISESEYDEMIPTDEETTRGATGGLTEAQFQVCVSGDTPRYFGLPEPLYPRKPDGLVVYPEGRCEFDEFVGGFDGVPSSHFQSGHSLGMDAAVEQMFPDRPTEQASFIEDMVELASLQNLEYPEDIAIADGGVRLDNIGRLNEACSELITIVEC